MLGEPQSKVEIILAPTPWESPRMQNETPEDKIKTWLALFGGLCLFGIVMNGLNSIGSWYQQATAIACKDDRGHQHIYCRMPDGSVQEWRPTDR